MIAVAAIVNLAALAVSGPMLGYRFGWHALYLAPFASAIFTIGFIAIAMHGGYRDDA